MTNNSSKATFTAAALALVLLCGAPLLRAQDTASLAAEAAALSQSRQYAQAKQKFQQALALSPNNATLHLSLGLTCQRLGELPQAVAALEQAVALNPSLVQAHYALGLVSEALAMRNPAQKAEHLARARKAWQSVIATAPPGNEAANTAAKHLLVLDINSK